MKRVVLVFLKFPEPGKVKTRLAEDLGDEGAALAYRQMVCRVFEQCRSARPDALAVAYDPQERAKDIREWIGPFLTAFPGEVEWLAQAPGDLGDRLEAAVGAVFRRFKDSGVLAIGSDCVHLDIGTLQAAWTSLEEGTDVVFGPAGDGGYYLVGLTDRHPILFRGIPWSSPETLESSMAAARRADLSVELLETRTDVDTLEEWKLVRSELSGRRCVFFDRDGVVNRSPGPGYVLSVDQFHLNPGVAVALAWLKERDWLTILVTSQRGVGKGLMAPEELERIHFVMQTELAASGASFDGIYAYTGEPSCRHLPKPDPEMIVSASESFFIDLRRSYLVGDADRDIEMGKAAGLAGTIRVKSEEPIGIEADWTVEAPTEILDLFGEIL